MKQKNCVLCTNCHWFGVVTNKGDYVSIKKKFMYDNTFWPEDKTTLPFGKNICCCPVVYVINKDNIKYDHIDGELLDKSIIRIHSQHTLNNTCDCLFHKYHKPHRLMKSRWKFIAKRYQKKPFERDDIARMLFISTQEYDDCLIHFDKGLMI